ncbi:hypothetical protein BC827DRAFT_1236238 [Russula dissimulans]|nr:hypothetical protein BC827DRAFT_1236238 [Russula dissimulans]
MWKTDVKGLLDSTDVQDPTDFPPSSIAPGLRALDSALRCNICQELYEAPVVLTCGHCFCSLCARNQLSEKPTCPTCWKETTVSGFRLNPAMEEAVTAWKDARQFVLRAINEALNPQTTASESSRPYKRRKPNSHIAVIGSGLASPQRRSGRSEIKEHRNLDVGTTSDDDVETLPSSEQSTSNNSNIECPVCAKNVPMARINNHLDSKCKYYLSTASSSTSGQKDAWSKLLGGKKSGKEREKPDAEPDTPLPKASYTVLKEKQIRDFLAAYDLSTSGDRSQLIARHERWVAVYNANLDRSPALRKRLADLRVEMRRWEEVRRKEKKEPLKADMKEYRRANKAEFDKLVELARPKSNRGDERPKPGVSAGHRVLSDGDEADRRLKAEASISEIEAITVDSDQES